MPWQKVVAVTQVEVTAAAASMAREVDHTLVGLVETARSPVLPSRLPQELARTVFHLALKAIHMADMAIAAVMLLHTCGIATIIRITG